MILHLDCTTCVITDSDDTVLSIAEARAAWEGGKITDCNLGFERLATYYDFDVEELRQFYAENS